MRSRLHACSNLLLQLTAWLCFLLNCLLVQNPLLPPQLPSEIIFPSENFPPLKTPYPKHQCYSWIPNTWVWSQMTGRKKILQFASDCVWVVFSARLLDTLYAYSLQWWENREQSHLVVFASISFCFLSSSSCLCFKDLLLRWWAVWIFTIDPFFIMKFPHQPWQSSKIYFFPKYIHFYYF